MAQGRLFEPGREVAAPPSNMSPLAEAMRPTSLDDVVGQQHLLGPGKPLRLLVEGRRLPSLLLWGPPGTGKTTLARVLAHSAQQHFVGLSAVQVGIKEVREVVEEARVRAVRSVHTVLFLDEIHRFNKSQQDALLPHVESGLLTLIGATTENPSFEVNPALLSRMSVYTLKSLSDSDILALLRRALVDPRGLGAIMPPFSPTEEALAFVARQADGDARKGLGLLEQLHRASSQLPGGQVVDEEVARTLLQLRGPRYDKGGEEHYNVISAFIKSMRGSDPHAAVYWLTRMLEAGESVRFIARRMIIFASEDVGNADPRALMMAVATSQAVEHVGLPEAAINLAQTTTYLATAPKSKASYQALRAAQEEIQRSGSLPVPLHLRNAPTRLMEREGYGANYQDPHQAPGHFVREQYLPDSLAGRSFYTPTDQGYELQLGERLRRWWGTSTTTDRPPRGPGDTST